MLEYIFKAILVTTIIGSLATALLTAIRPMTKKYFSAGWHYYIWLVVLVIMIMPVRFILPVNGLVGDTAEKHAHIQKNILDEGPVLEPFQIEETSHFEFEEPQDESSSIRIIAENKIGILSKIWLLGVVVSFLFKVLSYLFFLKTLRHNSEEIVCFELEKYTPKSIATRVSDKISSPLLLGIFSPTLLLPKTAMTKEQFENVLAHEMTHFKRKDILYKWFVCVVKCIHWFNPVLYYVANQVNVECEISCDIATIDSMNREQENSYIDTILALVTAKNHQMATITTAMAGDKKSLERRFKMIKNRKKVSGRVLVFSVILGIVILVGSVFASGLINGKFVNKYENLLMAVKTDERNGENFNSLILGLDEQNRADTIMLLSIKDGEVVGISVPRNTIFMKDGIKAGINEILGGANGDQVLIDAVRDAFSQPVNYYVKVKLSAIKEIVDNVGGIEVDVPMDMEYDDPEQGLHIKLKQGRQTLNGNAICGLLQFRHSNDGVGYNDEKRIEIGQQFIKEFISQKLNKGFIGKSKEIFKILGDNIETNYPVANLINDITLLNNMKSDIRFETISGTSITDDNGFMLPENEPVLPEDEPELKEITFSKILEKPCEGKIVNGFGKRIHPITNETSEHNGIDIKAPKGTEVISSMSGIVTDAGFDAEKGNYVIVERDNVKTVYSQLDSYNVKKGDTVASRQVIGKVGSTGNSTGDHLHFEVMIDGEYCDPKSLMK